jgi:hypothetical protein
VISSLAASISIIQALERCDLLTEELPAISLTSVSSRKAETEIQK